MTAQHVETLRGMRDRCKLGESAEFEALTAALSALQGQGWMPIESAPKDGTVVLLCAPSWLSPGVGAYEDGHWLDCGFGYAPEPTHWQPLPTPPAAHAQAGEGSNG